MKSIKLRVGIKSDHSELLKSLNEKYTWPHESWSLFSERQVRRAAPSPSTSWRMVPLPFVL